MSASARPEGINPDTAEIAGFIAETLLYGVYLTLWIVSTGILLDRHRLRRPVPTPVNKPILCGSCTIFLAVTAHWILDCIRITRGFLYFSNIPGGTLLYFAKSGDPINVARTGLMLFAGWILDAFLVYRLYIIWEESIWHTLPPSLGLLGLFISAVMTIYKSTQLTIAVEVYHTSAGKWITAAFTMSVVTNVIASSLIAYRLAKVSQTTNVLGVSRIRGLVPVVRIIIESAFVYCVCCIVTLVSYLAKSGVVTISAGITSSVIGISFSLIIVRVGIELGQRPYLPTSLPRRSSHRGGAHRVHTFSPSHPSFPTTPDFETSEFDSTPDSPSVYESRETLPAFAMNVRLPSKGGTHARASGEDVPRDTLVVKTGG